MGDDSPPHAHSAADGAAAAANQVVERRLRQLGSAGAALAAAVLVAAGTIGWTAGRDGGQSWMVSPPGDSFMMACGAMLLVLLSSAAHARILRHSADADAADLAAADPAGSADPAAPAEEDRPATVGSRLGAYSWATGLSFGMLAVAAALGAFVALGGKAPFYGLVICLAVLLGMLARWPRRSSFELELDRERPPAQG